MAAGLKLIRFLDPRECWKKWNEHGASLKKIQEEFLRSGKVNSRTGNPPTITGIEKAAFQFAVENMAEAHKDLEASWLREGEILTDDAWNTFIVNAAKNIFHQRPRRLERFLREHGLEDYT